MASERNMRMEEVEKRATRDARKDCPNDENSDQLSKRERDY